MHFKLALALGTMMFLTLSILAADVLVNTDPTGTQQDPQIVVDANGIVTIVWSSRVAGSTEWRTFARRFDEDGTPLGDQFQVNTVEATGPNKPAVAARQDGGFSVVWHRLGPNYDLDIFGRTFDANGAAIGPEAIINTTTTNHQRDPSIATRPENVSIVVWDCNANGSSGEVLARYLDADGLPLGPEFQIYHPATYEGISQPQVTTDSSGRFVVIWDDSYTGPSGSDSGFRGKLHGVDGTEITAFSGGGCNDYWEWCGDSKVSMSDTGFVVVWNETNQWDGYEDKIVAKHFDADGETINSRITVASGEPSQPDVTKSDDFIVSWRAPGPEYDDIHAQQYSSIGHLVGQPAIINEILTDNQRQVAVARKSNGQVIYVWTGPDGDVDGIWASFDDCFPLSTAVEPPEAGWVFNASPANCPNGYFSSSSAELNAQPAHDHHFSHWTVESGGWFIDPYAQTGEFVIDGEAATIAVFVPEALDTPLADGQSAGAAIHDGWKYFLFDVPACADIFVTSVFDVLTVETGNPDIDLYLRYGAAPTASEYYARSATDGDGESVLVEDPAPGLWWVGVVPGPSNTAAAAFTIHARSEGCEGDGPMSWWAGESNADDSAGSNDGTPQGGLQYSPGWTGTAFDFDGVDGSVEIPDDPSLDIGTGDFTLSFWIRSTDDVGVAAIQDKRTLTTGYHAFLWHGRVGVQLSDGVSSETFVAERFVADGEPHHVAITVGRNTSNGGRILVDGRTELVFDPTTVSGSLGTNESFMLGQRCAATGGDAFIDGIVDEVKLYDRALPAREAGDPLGNLSSWWRAEGNSHDRQGIAFLSAHDVAYENGVEGQAFALDGTSSFVTGSGPGPQDGDFSIVFWSNALIASSKRTVLDDHCGFPERGIRVFFDNGQPAITLSNGYDGSSTFSAPEIVTSNEWHSVVITVDRDSMTGGRIFIDGEPVLTFDPREHQGSLFHPDAQLTIGRRTEAAGVGHHFRGLLDEIMIYDKALSSQEVFYLVGSPPSLVFYDGFSSGGTTVWGASVP